MTQLDILGSMYAILISSCNNYKNIAIATKVSIRIIIFKCNEVKDQLKCINAEIVASTFYASKFVDWLM